MAKCPECKATVPANAVSCEACGLGVDEGPAPARRVVPRSDASSYGMIIGGTIVAVIIFLFLASFMGGTQCGECKGKGSVVCTNCRDGISKCVACKGSGADLQTQSTCMTCQGKGTSPVCAKCKGTPRKSCPSCGGKGSR